MQLEHDEKWIKYISSFSKYYFTPTFLGSEYIDASKPAMYVGNHTMYGILDTPMIIDYLYNEHKVAVVSIADHSHFYLPLWRQMVKKLGAIDGVKEYVRQVMSDGYSILVFPGGGREVLKRQGEEYQLIWKQRYGFLRLAQEFNYDIVPFASLGGDEAFEIGVDAKKIVENPIFQKILTFPQMAKFLRHGEVIPSLPKNIIPKRLPFYFKFMQRQCLEGLESESDLVQFRDKIQQQIYTGLQELKEYRNIHAVK